MVLLLWNFFKLYELIVELICLIIIFKLKIFDEFFVIS